MITENKFSDVKKARNSMNKAKANNYRKIILVTKNLLCYTVLCKEITMINARKLNGNLVHKNVNTGLMVWPTVYWYGVD